MQDESKTEQFAQPISEGRVLVDSLMFIAGVLLAFAVLFFVGMSLLSIGTLATKGAFSLFGLKIPLVAAPMYLIEALVGLITSGVLLVLLTLRAMMEPSGQAASVLAAQDPGAVTHVLTLTPEELRHIDAAEAVARATAEPAALADAKTNPNNADSHCAAVNLVKVINRVLCGELKLTPDTTQLLQKRYDVFCQSIGFENDTTSTPQEAAEKLRKLCKSDLDGEYRGGYKSLKDAKFTVGHNKDRVDFSSILENVLPEMLRKRESKDEIQGSEEDGSSQAPHL